MTPKVSDPGRAMETEAAIIEAARDLLADGGLPAVSMRAVGQRVGVSATTIYNYFENKESLVERIVALGFQRFESYLARAIEEQPVGSMDRVAAIGSAYARFAVENVQYFRIIFTIQPRTPRDLDELPGRGGYDLLRQCVLEAIESGAMRATDPDVVVLYLWSVVHGLVTIFLACSPEPLLEEMGIDASDPGQAVIPMFEAFRELVADGLAGPGGDR